MTPKFFFCKLTFEEVYTFLIETDKDFPTPLSDHVDICRYAKKLSEFSEFSICLVDGSIVGMISCYTNQPPLGYISNVCIKKQYQGKRLFAVLFQNLMTHLKDLNVKYLQLEVDPNNKKAFNVYQHYGFNIKEINYNTGKVLMERLL